MRAKFICLVSIGAVLMVACQLALSQAGQNANQSSSVAERHGTHVWIERNWTIRYAIMITQTWPSKRKAAMESDINNKAGQSFSWERIFEPTAAILIPNPPTSRSDRISIVLMEFDKQGFLITSQEHGSPLRGRLNRLQYITLSSGDGPVDSQYDLGRWFTGIGDASTDWAPGICGLRDMPSPFSASDTLYLYGAKFQISEFGPTFGCREWSYQLYDDERPYIDVTSYVRVGKIYPKYTYIDDVIGWARFGDKKPVIGQHEGNWYCLHDCTGNDKPGSIPDIKAWAAKNGWAAPKPPTKAPTFPDPPATPGTYAN